MKEKKEKNKKLRDKERELRKQLKEQLIDSLILDREMNTNQNFPFIDGSINSNEIKGNNMDFINQCMNDRLDSNIIINKNRGAPAFSNKIIPPFGQKSFSLGNQNYALI